MGRHFARAMSIVAVLGLLGAGACIIKTKPGRRGAAVTQKHKKQKKHKKHNKHKKHKDHGKHHKHRHRN